MILCKNNPDGSQDYWVQKDGHLHYCHAPVYIPEPDEPKELKRYQDKEQECTDKCMFIDSNIDELGKQVMSILYGKQ